MENLSVCVLPHDRDSVVPLVGYEGHPDESDYAGDSRHHFGHAWPGDGCGIVDAVRWQHSLFNALRLHFDVAVGVHDPAVGCAAVLSSIDAQRTPTPLTIRSGRTFVISISSQYKDSTNGTRVWTRKPPRGPARCSTGRKQSRHQN